MTTPIIIDAGPSLNFLATNNERILFRVVQKRLHAPETVRDEVLNKSRTDRRFAPAEGVWKKVERGFITVLDDTPTVDLNAAAQAVIDGPLAQRKSQAKDLGEVMVVIHAVAVATTGQDVQVIIDDTGGRELANAQAARLDRLRDQGEPVGRLTVFDTLSILEVAAGSPDLPDKQTMRKVYTQLRSCDDGLIPIEQTQLLSDDLWKRSAE